MEMTECGKHGKPRSRRSTLPTLLGNPFGIATFPPPRLLAYFKMREHERPNPRPLDLKGVVMEVLGPKCNGCSGTLTPLRSLGVRAYVSGNEDQRRVPARARSRGRAKKLSLDQVGELLPIHSTANCVENSGLPYESGNLGPNRVRQA